MLKGINEQMTQQVSYGEFLRWLGLWFSMATTHFEKSRDFWSSKAPNMFSGAPYRFSEFMSRNRLENILSYLVLTDRNALATLDRFWEIQQIVDAWNKNMAENFTPSWVCCLDESMSKWLGEYTCPGFMVVPRKGWPFGNEWHTICCSQSGVLFAVEIVEGKDQPPSRVKNSVNWERQLVSCCVSLSPYGPPQGLSYSTVAFVSSRH